jgi:F0F1-type ATP synthase delta subunit
MVAVSGALSTKYLSALEEVARSAGKSEELVDDVRQVYQFLRLPEGTRYMNLVKSGNSFKSLCKFFPAHIASWLSIVMREAATAAQLKPLLEYWLERNTSEFTAYCTTALPLDPELQSSITRRLQITYPDISVVYRTDPKIKGGIKFVLPHRVVDVTIATRLRALGCWLGVV